MTETQHPHEPSTEPGDLLLTLIVALLAPLFLTAGNGDIAFARLAAIQTVSAYRARSQADLITIAQIVGCGLAALGSLGLSMADNLSTSMILRLRGNAVALNRTVEQNRKALAASQAAEPATLPPDPAYEAKVLANVATAQKLTARAAADLRKPEPRTAVPQRPIATQTPASATQREWQVMLANAMTDVAAEFSAEAASLPPAQRHLASLRADALSSAATEVILGNIPPPMKPGDLAAFMPPNTPRK